MKLSIPTDSELSVDELLRLLQDNFSRVIWLALNNEIPADQIIDETEFNQVSSKYDINDEQVKNSLNELQVSSNVTKWFISPSEIEKLINNIESQSHGKVVILKDTAVQFINLYILSKISAAISFHFFPDVYDEAFTNAPNAALKKMFRRKMTDGVLANPKTELDKHLATTVDVLAKSVPTNFDHRRFLTSFASGDTDRYFLTEVFSCFHAPDMERRDLYYLVAPLFRLICQDRNIMSESEHAEYSRRRKLRTGITSKNNTKEGYYNEYVTYRSYLASIFRSIDKNRRTKG
jgi:hypothetical protein